MKGVLCVLAIVGAGGGVAHLWGQAEPAGGFDFATFYAAGKLATTDRCAAVYDRIPGDESKIPPDGALAQAATEAGYPTPPGQYYNLPICLLLFKPLTLLSFAGAYRLTTAANLAALVLLVWLTARAAAPRASPPNTFLGFAGLCVVACLSHPVAHNTSLGNISLLLALAYAVAFVWDRRDRPVAAGVVLGLSVVLKPSPILLVLFFVLRGRWRTAGTALATAVVLTGVGVAYYGPAMHVRWWELMSFYSYRTFPAWNDQSLLAGLLRFAVPMREVAGWEVLAAPAWMGWIQRIALVAALAWWVSRCRRWTSVRGAAAGFGAGMMLMTIASPFAWTHYFVLAVWPIAIVAAELFEPRRRDRGRSFLLLAVIVAAWMANPQTVFELSQRLSDLPVVGASIGRCLVSNTLAAGVALFMWLQVLGRRGGSAAG